MDGLRELERPIEAAEVVDGIRVRVDEHMSSMGKWEKFHLLIELP